MLGQQEAAGARNSRRPPRTAQGIAAGGMGRAFKLLAFGSATGLVLGILASRVLASIVYQASFRDPMVLAGVVLAMSMLGLLATWIPARSWQ